MEDKEIITKLKNCKTVDELKTLGKEIGYELTDEEAKACFDKFTKSGELSDNELSNVSGGGCTKWRKGRAYSGNPPHRLIVTTINTCSMWFPFDGTIPGRTCYQCKRLYRMDSPGIGYYCNERTYDNDPLNPKN